MLRLDTVVGHRDDPAIARHVHELAHRERVEYLDVPTAEAGRRRLRWPTDRGTDCAISLPREQRLADGAVLLLEPERAIVVRVGEPQQWRLRPVSAEAALRLGWLAGHLHWRVRFASGDLIVLLDADEAEYRARIAPLLDTGALSIVDDGEPT